MSSNLYLWLTEVDNLLNNYIQASSIARNAFNKIWQAFMAFSYSLVATAIKQASTVYNVIMHSLINGNIFTFPLFPSSSTGSLITFETNKQNKYALLMNSYVLLRQYTKNANPRINLDILVVKVRKSRAFYSYRNDFKIISHKDYVTFFAECKNTNAYPELVATVSGQKTLIGKTFKSHPYYSLNDYLLVSGSAFNAISEFLERNSWLKIKILSNLRPIQGTKYSMQSYAKRYKNLFQEISKSITYL